MAVSAFNYSRVSALIGITELDLLMMEQRRKEEIEKFIDRDNKCFINGEKRFSYGEFKTLKVAELTRLVHPNKTKVKCSFEISENTDIGNLSLHQESMVQVASNFNCLEFPSPSYVNTGYLVEKAHRDSTQGPAACFGPLAAYLYRAHFIPPINLLEHVEDYFGTLRGGKIQLSGREKEIENVDEVTDNIMIGLHMDAEMLYNRQGLLETPFLIDQCFNSTINLNYIGSRNEKLNKIIRCLLRASYEGVFMAAIYRKRKYLYLTLIGGGVFNNPIDIILEELIRAYQKWTTHPSNTLVKVFLCLYDDRKSVISKFEILTRE